MGYTPDQVIEKRKQLWKTHHSLEKDMEFLISFINDVLLQDIEFQKQLQLKPEYIIEIFFYIVDKDKQTVPFFINDVQRDFTARINNAMDDYKVGKRLTIKFLVLKGRQQGFTTLITAYQLACTISRKNFEGFTCADCDDNTSAIFENKAKFPYNRLPAAIKPSEKYNNRRQLLFDKINSSWEVKTASKNMGRSRTINFMHGSEAAFWKDGISNIQAGLGEALTKDAIQILESTANGYNEFKDLWDSDAWENCFYEWWRTQEYRFSFESEEVKQKFSKMIKTGQDWIHERCRWLLIDMALDIEQVYWYYNKWLNYIDKNLIKQEYPCHPEEAFLASGSCVFDTEVVMQRKRQLEAQYEKEVPRQGQFIITWNNPDRMDYPTSIKWTEDKHGYIKIYEDVKPKVPYVIGGDTKGEGSDRFALSCINNNTGNRCAILHGEMSSKDYTAQAWAMAMYYNEALLGIETNFNTYPIELLQDWHYPHQYMREKKDTITGELKKQHGFRTDTNTRPLIIEKEITVVNEDIGLFTDIEMLNEMLTFVKDEKGRPDAEEGKHDDLLFADMIANEIRGQQTHIVEEDQEQEEYEEDDREYSMGGWYD